VPYEFDGSFAIKSVLIGSRARKPINSTPLLKKVACYGGGGVYRLLIFSYIGTTSTLFSVVLGY
jgi:hypothetical protein